MSEEFEYDYFIAYVQEDAKEYADNLKDFIERHWPFKCFLDRTTDRLGPGEDLNKELPGEISRSRAMILIGTRGVFQSEWVPLELEEFFEQEKQIIPISIDGSLSKESLANKAEFARCIADSILRVYETQDAVDEGRPSGKFRDDFYRAPAVEKARRDAEAQRHKEARLLRAIASIVAILCLIALVAAWQFNDLKKEAQASNREAIQAKQKAIKAKQVAESSELLMQKFEDDLHHTISVWQLVHGSLPYTKDVLVSITKSFQERVEHFSNLPERKLDHVFTLVRLAYYEQLQGDKSGRQRFEQAERIFGPQLAELDGTEHFDLRNRNLLVKILNDRIRVGEDLGMPLNSEQVEKSFQLALKYCGTEEALRNDKIVTNVNYGIWKIVRKTTQGAKPDVDKTLLLAGRNQLERAATELERFKSNDPGHALLSAKSKICIALSDLLLAELNPRRGISSANFTSAVETLKQLEQLDGNQINMREHVYALMAQGRGFESQRNPTEAFKSYREAKRKATRLFQKNQLNVRYLELLGKTNQLLYSYSVGILRSNDENLDKGWLSKADQETKNDIPLLENLSSQRLDNKTRLSDGLYAVLNFRTSYHEAFPNYSPSVNATAARHRELFRTLRGYDKTTSNEIFYRLCLARSGDHEKANIGLPHWVTVAKQDFESEKSHPKQIAEKRGFTDGEAVLFNSMCVYSRCGEALEREVEPNPMLLKDYAKRGLEIYDHIVPQNPKLVEAFKVDKDANWLRQQLSPTRQK